MAHTGGGSMAGIISSRRESQATARVEIARAECDRRWYPMPGRMMRRIWVQLVFLLAAATAWADVVDHLGNTDNMRLVAAPEVTKAWRTAGSLKTNTYFG